MPRDTIALLEAIPDLSTPSLEGLAYLLRHPEKWPEGFKWDYSECSQCAMGLAFHLWNSQVIPRLDEPDSSYHIASRAARCLLGFTGDDWDFEGIFRELDIVLGVYHQDVLPIHVATAIEAYLANRRHKRTNK